VRGRKRRRGFPGLSPRVVGSSPRRFDTVAGRVGSGGGSRPLRRASGAGWTGPAGNVAATPTSTGPGTGRAGEVALRFLTVLFIVGV
jgi:hypothetical protein